MQVRNWLTPYEEVEDDDDIEYEREDVGEDFDPFELFLPNFSRTAFLRNDDPAELSSLESRYW
jgi:hypothetical protein